MKEANLAHMTGIVALFIFIGCIPVKFGRNAASKVVKTRVCSGVNMNYFNMLKLLHKKLYQLVQHVEVIPTDVEVIHSYKDPNVAKTALTILFKLRGRVCASMNDTHCQAHLT